MVFIYLIGLYRYTQSKKEDHQKVPIGLQPGFGRKCHHRGEEAAQEEEDVWRRGGSVSIGTHPKETDQAQRGVQGILHRRSVYRGHHHADLQQPGRGHHQGLL